MEYIPIQPGLTIISQIRSLDNPNWSKWVAQWNVKCEYQGSYDLWQCTSKGSVDGISGNVDLNFLMEGRFFWYRRTVNSTGTGSGSAKPGNAV